jgi:hypothetical protein
LKSPRNFIRAGFIEPTLASLVSKVPSGAGYVHEVKLDGYRIQAHPREELKWQNIDADDLPVPVKKSFDAMVEAEAAFKADLEKLLKNEGHMPEDKFLVMSRKGKRLGVAFASTPRGEGGAGSLKFKTK